MRNSIHNLSTYVFSKEECVLVDTNIWLYLYPAPSEPSKGYIRYSVAIKNIMTSGAKIFIDYHILSEYINRYLRIEWNAQHKKNYRNFKDYRNSNIAKPVIDGVITNVKRILSFCTLTALPADTLCIDNILNTMSLKNVDFVDAILTDICRTHNLKLLTNDSDFKFGGIEVITSNYSLLQSSP